MEITTPQGKTTTRPIIEDSYATFSEVKINTAYCETSTEARFNSKGVTKLWTNWGVHVNNILLSYVNYYYKERRKASRVRQRRQEQQQLHKIQGLGCRLLHQRKDRHRRNLASPLHDLTHENKRQDSRSAEPTITSFSILPKSSLSPTAISGVEHTLMSTLPTLN